MNFLQSLLPAQSHTSFRERLRAGAGAFIALLLTGLLAQWMLAHGPAHIFLVGGKVVAALVAALRIRWLGNGVPLRRDPLRRHHVEGCGDGGIRHGAGKRVARHAPPQ